MKQWKMWAVDLEFKYWNIIIELWKVKTSFFRPPIIILIWSSKFHSNEKNSHSLVTLSNKQFVNTIGFIEYTHWRRFPKIRSISDQITIIRIWTWCKKGVQIQTRKNFWFFINIGSVFKARAPLVRPTIKICMELFWIIQIQ